MHYSRFMENSNISMNKAGTILFNNDGSPMSHSFINNGLFIVHTDTM